LSYDTSLTLDAGATYPVQAFLFAKLIGVFGLSGTELVSRGNFYSLMFFILALVSFIAYFLLGWSLTYFSARITRSYRLEYFKNIISQEIAFFDERQNSPGSLTSQLSSDPAALQELIGLSSGTFLVAIASLVGSTIMCFIVGWKLTLVALFAAFPPIFVAGYTRVKIELGFERRTAALFSHSAQFASEAVGAIRTVSSLNMEDTICQRYSDLLNQHAREALKKTLLSTILFAGSESVDLLSIALVFWSVPFFPLRLQNLTRDRYGSRLLANGTYTVTQFFIVFTAIVLNGQAAAQFFAISSST
jgi:ATP-binding cassette, subfamily B (MDR/TAP), member 1